MAMFAFVGCKHEPVVKDQPVAAEDVRPGEFIIGTYEAVNVDAVLELAIIESYRFEYVAAATETTHLLRASWADGTSLTSEETKVLAEKLVDTHKFKFVELNSVKNPR